MSPVVLHETIRVNCFPMASFVVRVGVEGEPGDFVFLAALKNSLLPEAFVDRFVLRPDTAGGGVYYDIGSPQHSVYVACDLDACRIKRWFNFARSAM